MRKGVLATVLVGLMGMMLAVSACGTNTQTNGQNIDQSTIQGSEQVTEQTNDQNSGQANEQGGEQKKEENASLIKDLDSVSQLSDNKFTCSYDGVKHDFLVFLPDSLNETQVNSANDAQENFPFVIMLHGYGDSAEGFCNKVHFEEKANARGYAVIYVDGAPDPNDPTSASGWNSGIGSGGNDDVGFLSSLATYLENEYSFDKSRAYVAGFSNGAFMTYRLAMEAPEGTFASVVSVAGKMTASVYESRLEEDNKSNKNNKSKISIFQVTGTKDDVVPQSENGSDKYMDDPAIEEVIEYWADSNGLEESETEEVGKNSSLLKFCNEEDVTDKTDSEKSDKESVGNEVSDKKVQVWHLRIKDGRHSWPEESITGIDINSLILDFFDGIS